MTRLVDRGSMCGSPAPRHALGSVASCPWGNRGQGDPLLHRPKAFHYIYISAILVNNKDTKRKQQFLGSEREGCLQCKHRTNKKLQKPHQIIPAGEGKALRS